MHLQIATGTYIDVGLNFSDCVHTELVLVYELNVIDKYDKLINFQCSTVF